MNAEVILVEGTWGRGGGDRQWWRKGSIFWKALETYGFDWVKYGDPDLRFDWDYRLEGIFGKNTRWHNAAKRLVYYIAAYKDPRKKLVVIAHSHGGQVATLAAAYGASIDVLVTMATPVRRDLRVHYLDASKNVNHWIHIHSDRSDWMQWLGSLFDGTWKLRRKMVNANWNIAISGVGHSGMLDPAMWDEHRIYEQIQAGLE